MREQWNVGRESATTALTAVSALAGLSWFAAARPLWFRAASPGQVPGFARLNGIDPHGPLLLVAGAILFALLGAAFGAFAGRKFADGRSLAWAFGAAVAAALAVPWLATSGASSEALAIPLLAMVALVRLRHFEIGLTWDDLMLIPALLPLHAGIVELFHGLSGVAALVLSVSALVSVRVVTRSAKAMLFAPLALFLETGFASDDQPVRAAIAVAFVLVAPLVTAFILRSHPIPRRTLRRIQLLLYPIALVAYTHILMSTSAPTINLFEHGFDLATASELLRGKALYRDIFPMHGPLADGVIDLIGMKLLGATAGGALTFRYWIALLNVVALFAVGTALTRSPMAGFLGVLADISLYPATIWSLGELSPLLMLRAGASFAALAFAIRSVAGRNRDLAVAAEEPSVAPTRWKLARRWSDIAMIAAGAMAVVAGLVSIDFGLYACAAVVAAVWVSCERMPALGRAAAGAAVALAPFVLYLLVTGSMAAFIRSVFIDERAFIASYSLGYFTPARCCGGQLHFPDLLLLPFVRVLAFQFAGWIVVLIAWCVMLTRRLPQRVAPFFIAATWIVVSAASYVERTKEYFSPLLGPIVVAAAFVLFRRKRPFILIALAVAASFGAHFIRDVPAAIREREVEVPRLFATWPELPRAGSALFVREDLPHLEKLRSVMAQQLGQDETFYTFTNLVVLHFLFDKPMTLPYAEVPMYEFPRLQGEMTARLEQDRQVRVVVQHFPYWSDTLDGVPNEDRVPSFYLAIQRDFPLVMKGDGIMLRLRPRLDATTP